VVGDVGEVTTITTVCGSASEVAGAALATSAGGGGRRRHLLRPNHGGRVQSRCTRSSTGWCRGYARKESRNGSVDYLVHVLRQGHELRRAWSHCSGGASPRLKLGKASRPPEEAIHGLGSSGGGREWFGHGGRPRAALAGHGEVAGAVGWLGKARRGAEGVTGKMAVHEGEIYSHLWARQGCGHGGGRGRAGGACERALGAFPSACPRRTSGGLLLPVFPSGGLLLPTLACRSQQKSRVRYLLCTISYLFHVSSKQRYGRGWEILWCEVGSVRAVPPETKTVSSHVKRLRVGFKFFQGVLGVFRRHFVDWDLWFWGLEKCEHVWSLKEGWFWKWEKSDISFMSFSLVTFFGVFLKPFWGHSLTIFCRVLSLLQLL
jgi:hypothetical protein